MSKQTYRIQLPNGDWFLAQAEGIYHFTALVNNKLWQSGILPSRKTVMPVVVKKSLNKKLVV